MGIKASASSPLSSRGSLQKTFRNPCPLQYNRIVDKNTTAAVDSVMGEAVEPEKMETAAPVAGDIEFKSVTFRYGTKEVALQDVSVMFRENSVNAVVGLSGAGKTTLVT